MALNRKIECGCGVWIYADGDIELMLQWKWHKENLGYHQDWENSQPKN
jgi:hypothetical protein